MIDLRYAQEFPAEPSCDDDRDAGRAPGCPDCLSEVMGACECPDGTCSVPDCEAPVWDPDYRCPAHR